MKVSGHHVTTRERKLRLLYFMPYARGGLAQYAVAQTRALIATDQVEVLMLAPSDLETPPGVRRTRLRLNAAPAKQPKTKLARAVKFARKCMADQRALDEAIREERPDAVLIGGFSEYFAPVWAWRFRKWRRKGVRFAAVVHDPVRDYVRGPRWWHRLSIAEAYSYLDIAFVHEPVDLDTVRAMLDLKIVPVPHGLFEIDAGDVSREEARARMELPEHAKAFLSFGHIRDGKNLNLFIHAMCEFPDVYLIVAGSEQSAGQKSATHYQQLASRLGVADRIRWDIRYIPASEAQRFFRAADFLLLTYSGNFKSASGALAAAAHYGFPCLASSGDGPLKTAVQTYDLGVFVRPDCPNAVRGGLCRLLQRDDEPDWRRYRADHSWETNATIVASSLETGLRRITNTGVK